MTRAADLAKLIAGSSTLGGTGELVLKDVDTADGSSPKITFQTGDTDIAQDDVLGTINFQAPDEGTGTDAILVSAGVEAKAEGDFSSSSNATSLTFKTGSSEAAAEKMRVDSSGNLLVGKTSASGSTVGGEIRSDGRVLAVVDDNYAGFFARKSADGEIVRFLKDTTTVGSISAVSSDLAIFSSASSHTGLRLANGYIAPTNNSGTISDNTADLGISNYRFKDLFLSGGAYIGGTGSANYLDDYEEGTHDCTVTMASGSVTLNSGYNKIKYTKVGRVVTIQGQINVSSVSSPSGLMQISMPFSIDTTNDEGANISGGTVRAYNADVPTGGLYLFGTMVFNTGANLQLEWVKASSATVNHVPKANEYLIISFSYATA
jgi:hypothetical protein